jgi:hypothetical protein
MAELYTAFGQELTLDQWAWESGLPRRTIEARLRVGLPMEVAVSLERFARIDPTAPLGGPGSWTWYALDFEDDKWAKAFVKLHPGGASLDAVGDALGMTRERVRQLEEQIFAKLRRMGIHEVEDLRAAMEAA